MTSTIALFVNALIGTAGAGADRPNVVVFLADDLGYGDLGCYGHLQIKTPNADRLAAEGIRLTQCYAASAVCSPSRSAIMTGRTPHRNGVYTWIAAGSEVHLRKSESALPAILKSADFSTCHVGKWHLNGRFNRPAQPQPNDHGYDHWMATQNNANPNHKNPDNFVRNGIQVGKTEGYSAQIVADEAVRWLNSGRDKSKPFFLTVWTHEPHEKIESDPRFQAMYPDVADPDVKQHHANVTQMDAALGTVLKALDDLKLAESTLVVFTSDNGPEGDGIKGRSRGSSGGLRGRKRALYEGGIRVPGIVRWPGRVKAGTTSDFPIIGSDLFPTVLAATRSNPPVEKTIDGIDVLPILTGEKVSVERRIPLFWRLHMAPYGLHIAMREGDWKILASADFSKAELYDLKADPKETTDLREKNPARFATMLANLKSLNAEIDAEGPDWWKRLDPDGGRAPKKAGKL